MSRLMFVIGVTVMAASAGRPAHATSVYYPPSFTGCWMTSCGTVSMKQSGSCVTGWYDGGCASISGQVCGNVLQAEWKHNGYSGYCEFTLNSNCSGFSGYWRYWNSNSRCAWNGSYHQPTFQGEWCTTYGKVRLFVNNKGGVFGQFYQNASGDYLGEITGQVKGNVIEGRWKCPSGSGYCYFRLCEEGAYIDGCTCDATYSVGYQDWDSVLENEIWT